MTVKDRFGVPLSVGDEVYITCNESRTYWLRAGKVTLIDDDPNILHTNSTTGQPQILVEHTAKDGTLHGGIWWQSRHTALLTEKNVLKKVEAYENAEVEIPDVLANLLKLAKERK